jgi:hypothetical protein
VWALCQIKNTPLPPGWHSPSLSAWLGQHVRASACQSPEPGRPWAQPGVWSYTVNLKSSLWHLGRLLNLSEPVSSFDCNTNYIMTACRVKWDTIF